MKKNMIIAAAILASGLGAATLNNAFAASDNAKHDPVEAQAVLGAKVSAMDAAAAALREVPGKVAEIGFDSGKSGVSYEVTVIAADGSEHDLKVDGATGAVTKMTFNHDNEGGNDQDMDGDKGDNG